MPKIPKWQQNNLQPDEKQFGLGFKTCPNCKNKDALKIRMTGIGKDDCDPCKFCGWEENNSEYHKRN